MSLLIQTIIIAVIAIIVNIFSPILAQWLIWVWYLSFAVILFFKGLSDRKDLRNGGVGDLSGALVLPLAMILVIFILVLSLFLGFNKFHLLWLAPSTTLLVEFFTGRITYGRFEKSIIREAGERRKQEEN